MARNVQDLALDQAVKFDEDLATAFADDCGVANIIKQEDRTRPMSMKSFSDSRPWVRLQ